MEFKALPPVLWKICQDYVGWTSLVKFNKKYSGLRWMVFCNECKTYFVQSCSSCTRTKTHDCLQRKLMYMHYDFVSLITLCVTEKNKHINDAGLALVSNNSTKASKKDHKFFMVQI